LAAVNALFSECTIIPINEKDDTGCTALYRAVANDHLEISKLLLTLGASANEATSDGNTPLHAAAKNGNLELCKLLVQHGAKLDAVTNANSSALHVAGMYNCDSSILYCYSCALLFFNTCCLVQVQQNQFCIVQYLLASGANVNISSSSLPSTSTSVAPSHNRTKSSSIYYESSNSSSNNSNNKQHRREPSLSGALISMKALPQIHMPSPLIVACSIGSADIVQLLLENGASAIDDTSDVNGSSPLMTACEHGHADVVSLLIEIFKSMEPNVNATEQINKKCTEFHSWAPLHYCANSGHAEVCRILLDNGAFMDSLDDIGRTPLHHASAKGHPEVVSLLVERGANVDIRDDNFIYSESDNGKPQGKTPMDLASESIQYHRVAKAFREAIAKRKAQYSPPININSKQQQQAQPLRFSMHSPFGVNFVATRPKRELPVFLTSQQQEATTNNNNNKS